MINVTEVWTVCVAFYEGDASELTNLKTRLVLSGRKIRWRRSHIFVCADPFLICDDKRLWLFFEEQRHGEKGRISAISTSDLIIWRNHGTVLQEHYHLSYPQVFKYEGRHWMIPEAAESGAVWLYQSESLDGPWSRSVRLLATPHLDPTIIFFGNRCYLWATDMEDTLRLYHADSLGSKFLEHPSSPITNDKRFSRCGGRPIILADGSWARLAQDGSISYGRSLNVMRIDRLSANEYRETLFKEDILPRNNDWNINGGHHLDLEVFNGTKVCAYDGRNSDLAINIFARLFWGFLGRLGLQK
jgi:hypothetical protein